MAFLKSFLYLGALGVLSHYVGEAIPVEWFHHDRFPFRVWRWERDGRIYDMLSIRAWKDRVPDMSRVMRDMVPKRLGRCPTSALAWRLVGETCRAEIVHVALCACTPVVCLFWNNGVGVLLTGVAVLGNLPFILIQRYNRPSLVRLARRLELREERKKHEGADPVG